MALILHSESYIFSTFQFHCHFNKIAHQASSSMCPVFLITFLLPSVRGDYGDIYQMSRNISVSNFYGRVILTEIERSIKKYINYFLSHNFSDHLSCAHLCSRRRVSVGDCNSFSFDNMTSSCSLAWLTYLEDPLPGNEAQA